MKRKRAVLVHINPMAGITPLAGGYIKSFAEQESGLKEAWDIELFSRTFDTSASLILKELVAKKPDLIGFSLYVWNIGLVERLLPALRGLLPDTQFLLGGVQVMNSAETYVDRTWDNVMVCNGEGERTFRDLLVQYESGAPDLGQVGGLTFVSDGQFITTEAQPRIKDLTEIPSPFLNGMFADEDMAIALLETNRGCPYKCEYCFWGGAVGQKLNRLPLDRIQAEIEFLASKRTRSVLICDSNLGIFPEDVDISRMLVDARKETGYPLRVAYSSAKNKPERAVEIAENFAAGGVLSSQPISLQTMDQHTLSVAKRHNIKPETYLSLQRRMNEIGVASFIELIWPLPGETLESFKSGIQELCCMGAQAFGIYPLVWLKNVGFEARKEELGVVTIDEGDPVGGGCVVIQTNEVSHQDWIDGMVFANAVMVLYDSRGLYATSSILNSLKIESFQGIFDRFVTWMKGHSKGALADLWHRGRQNFEEMYKFNWRGAVVETVLHTAREDFDQIIRLFTESLDDLIDGDHRTLLAAAVEFDLVYRPFPYVNTPFEVGAELKHIRIVEDDDRVFRIESPYDFPAILRAIENDGKIPAHLLVPDHHLISIDHRRGQIFRMPFTRDEDHHQFFHQFVTEIGNSLPICETSRAEEPALT